MLTHNESVKTEPFISIKCKVFRICHEVVPMYLLFVNVLVSFAA